MAYGTTRADNWAKGHKPRLILRSARKNMNLSIRELAHKVGYSASYLGEAEKGTCEMSVKFAQDLAKALLVSNWWDLCEKFEYKVKRNGAEAFIGDNGTEVIISTKNKK